MSEPRAFIGSLIQVAKEDVEGLIEARRLYGDSWRAEGGFSAFFNVKRKIDRLVNCCKREPVAFRTSLGEEEKIRERYNIFSQIEADGVTGGEATIDSVRDLRRYLMLVEAYLVQSRTELPRQRDNAILDNTANFVSILQMNIRTKEKSPGELTGTPLKSDGQDHPFGYDRLTDGFGEGIEDPGRI